MTKQELEREIELKRDEITNKQKEINNFKIDPYEHEEDYKENLDSEGEVNVCGLTFSPSKIIEELDPTAYRCGLIDFVDSLDVADDPGYKELEEELETLEDELTDLENELEELEEEEDDERE